MNRSLDFQVNKALEMAKKRRKRKFLISILQMVVILTAISLLFSFLIHQVWASPVPMEEGEKVERFAKERTIALKEKEVPVVEKVKVEVKSSEAVQPVQPKKEEAVPEFPYKEHLKLPYDHQKYLYERTKELGLDFDKALAVMEHESKFDANAIGETKDYGYFQVNITNHEWLSDVTNTPNKPLDPYVNIDWGTYMLKWLGDYWTERGLTGKALDEAVWSSYNKGIQGFRETGEATVYVAKVQESLNLVKQ